MYKTRKQLLDELELSKFETKDAQGKLEMCRLKVVLLSFSTGAFLGLWLTTYM